MPTAGVHKCTLCYDRTRDGMTPACAQACPTESIQFGPLDELRRRAGERLAQVVEAGTPGARLYGEDPDDGVGGFGAFFLLLDEPEVYGLPAAPVDCDPRTCPRCGARAAAAGAGLVGHGRAGLPGRPPMSTDRLEQGYYGRPILKPHVWKPVIAAYFAVGGLAGASSVLAAAADLAGNRRLARTASLTSAAAFAACPPLLIYDLGRPERFVNMLRVLKPTSPMSVGTWTLAAASAAQVTAAAARSPGRSRGSGRAAQLVAAALGPVMATYTGVLVSDTAVPAWVEARR